MAEQLGKIEKPLAEKFAKGRRLFFVPLILSAVEAESELQQKVGRYWDEVESQLGNLESRLGAVDRIFHEWVAVEGPEGAGVMEEVNPSSYRVMRPRIEAGTVVAALEDQELLAEYLDWNRCLSVGLQSQKVFKIVYEGFSEVNVKRNEALAKRIDETLGEGEKAILLMREGHHIQFPPDIEVFYVSPPSLDDIKRWVRDRETRYEREQEAEEEDRSNEGRQHGSGD
ncbi:MAG: hypothetical protein IBX68_08885 [Dehalococcoidia bacterium]|nr:hypothetical protein [Dehalococcoidia bacterium]